MSGRRGRSRDVLVFAVGRPVLFALWSLVAWGTVYLLALLHAVVSEGPATAFGRALSGGDALAARVNLTLAGIAVLVWAVVGVAVWRARRRRRRPGEGSG